VAWFGAVSYDSGFDVTDQRVGLLGTPETKIIDGVDKHGLTHRIRSFSGLVADIVTCLRSSSNRERVHLFREVGIGKVIRSEW
jgi:hypothetical protein